MSDYLYVKTCMIDSFEWGLDAVAFKEAKWRDEADSLGLEYDDSGNEWLLVSQVFIPRVLDAKDPPVKLLEEASRFIELLLQPGVDSITDIVVLRIVDNLLGYPDRWTRFRPYAGERLREIVDTQSGYYRNA
ncbi:hypothetical protein [Nocardioides panzhihuensis]|uniref:Uncharacterized protein n=1 Tax=Nocardioides panzhihuensis TaxID=860243 RepID=A0A7Z0IQ70_9ACTN|nr:hypothetical protein [Nocardioides panzhihuensis]NYI75483.1 hypothetical protein [Nocardioides panzhihuensis]